jgi:general secretion pathway protein H
LAVVVFLLGLFSLLATPLLSGPADAALSSSARRLAGTVKQLYNESALSGLEGRLIINLENGTYSAQLLERNGTLRPLPGAGKEGKLRGDTRFAAVAIAGRGSFAHGEVVTEFSPAGWLPETVIHLQDGERQLTLRLLSFTGITEVYEGYREF